jgi:hypothetical protein
MKEEQESQLRFEEETKEQQLKTPLLEGSNVIKQISNLLVNVILRYIVARKSTWRG